MSPLKKGFLRLPGNRTVPAEVFIFLKERGMALRKASGNMYAFVTHTWNPVKGKCGYGCAYCYVNRWGKQRPPRLDRMELQADLGGGNVIFVCSGCDLFHPDIPDGWTEGVFFHTRRFAKNQYVWHTKNPETAVNFLEAHNKNHDQDIVCVTIESNKGYPCITKAPLPIERITYLSRFEGRRWITIEPVLDFDLDLFPGMIAEAMPEQVNIGADSGNNNLPEPPPEKIVKLIEKLGSFTRVHLKNNLKRLLPEAVS
jgi:DNA repair photolyase